MIEMLHPGVSPMEVILLTKRESPLIEAITAFESFFNSEIFFIRSSLMLDTANIIVTHI